MGHILKIFRGLTDLHMLLLFQNDFLSVLSFFLHFLFNKAGSGNHLTHIKIKLQAKNVAGISITIALLHMCCKIRSAK